MKCYINLVGGLGNQLYILAYGDYLIRTYGFEITGYINQSGSGIATHLSMSDRASRPLYETLINFLGYKLLPPPSDSLTVRVLRRLFVERYAEPSLQAGVFFPEMPPLSRRACFPLRREIFGYFQSYKYVGDSFRKTVRRFILQQAPDAATDVGVEDVALHIRRGDFLKAPEIYYCYGVDYYLEALSILNEQCSIGKVYIFSDDFSAIQDEIKSFEQYYNCVLVTGQTSIEDLVTLSCFRRYTLGNSTFSWWGAFLSQYGDNVSVVVPQCPIKFSTPEDSYYPPHWFVVSDKY